MKMNNATLRRANAVAQAGVVGSMPFSVIPIRGGRHHPQRRNALRAAALYCILTLGMLLMQGAGAQVPASAERGRALYENHCVVCHTSQVHSRVNRLPVSRVEVGDIVEKWQAQQKLTWGTQEVEDVVEFLNRTRYQFP